MKRFFRNNGLSIVLLALFLIFWTGQAMAGYRVFLEEQSQHGLGGTGFLEYVGGEHFWQATTENWESEFLQMGAYVILTRFLYQRGSAESKDPDEEPKPVSEEARRRPFYAMSLTLAFLTLFLISFSLHAVSGWHEFNDEQSQHEEPAVSLGQFLGEPEFWFQSFQNWQSEFLAVASIVLLSIWLRQEGSPESKHVGDPDLKTGR